MRREIRRNGGSQAYRANRADRRDRSERCATSQEKEMYREIRWRETQKLELQ